MNTITHSVTKFVVHKRGDDPLLDDSATEVELLDEGGGRFIRISRPDTAVELYLDFEELEKLYSVAKLLWQ